MKERDFTRQLLDVARLQGWRSAHFGNSVKFVKRSDGYKAIPDKDATGFPDLVLTREGRLIFAELKCGKNKVTDTQAAWIADLREVERRALDSTGIAFVEVFLWTPDDWPEIEEVLA